MIESLSGLILRTRPLTETSVIVQWLTPQHGRLSTVAKGARRPQSPFRGKLDLFYEADFSFQRSRRSQLHILREVTLREIHAPLRRDLGHLRQASYGAALIEQVTEEETPLPVIYELMLGLLRRIPQERPDPLVVFTFELKLLEELGLMPDLEQTHLTPGTKMIARKLVQLDWTHVGQIRLSTAQGLELQRFLYGFMLGHLEKIPANRNAALQIDP